MLITDVWECSNFTKVKSESIEQTTKTVSSQMNGEDINKATA